MSALVHSSRARLDHRRSGGAFERELALLEAGRSLAEELADGRITRADVAATAASLASDRRDEPCAVALTLMVHASQAPSLLRREPEQACRVVLELVSALAPLERASLWTMDLGTISCQLWLGAVRPGPQARNVAQRLLDPLARTPTGVHDEIVTGTIARAGQTIGAVIGRAPVGDVAQADAFVSIACSALGLILERRDLLAHGAETERTLVAAHERRLTRLGFDLHDGPLQDVAVLVGDLRTARRHAEQELEPQVRERVVGVFDDLIARVSELNGGLRTMARWLEGASVVNRPLAEVIRREIDLLEARTPIAAELVASGDFDSLTDSQQITLFRVVQEALTNVREHSGAATVRITLTAAGAWTMLEIVDDGEGFDPETMLPEAADRGRLGLLGAAERVRLLGGALSVSSRPGKGTRLSASLPHWPARPDAEPVSA
jgi:signal transduction histidine kinase